MVWNSDSKLIFKREPRPRKIILSRLSYMSNSERRWKLLLVISMLTEDKSRLESTNSIYSALSPEKEWLCTPDMPISAKSTIPLWTTSTSKTVIA